VRCRVCGKEVRCEIHGGGRVVEDFAFDSEPFPFYYCEECFRELGSALGSVIHDHVDEAVRGLWKVYLGMRAPRRARG